MCADHRDTTARAPWEPGNGCLPLQGLSSFSIPLQRNCSVTTSLTFVKLGKMFLLWETALIQLVHCREDDRDVPGDVRQASEA